MCSSAKLVIYIAWRAVTPELEAAVRDVVRDDLLVDDAGDVRPIVQDRRDPDGAARDADRINAAADREGVTDVVLAAVHLDGVQATSEEAVAIARDLVSSRFLDGEAYEDAPRLVSVCDVGTAWAMVWFVGSFNSFGVLVDKASRKTVLRYRGEMMLAGLG